MPPAHAEPDNDSSVISQELGMHSVIIHPRDRIPTPELRRAAYRAQIRDLGLDRDPEHALRARAGVRAQAALSRRPLVIDRLPVPRHRALVPIE